MVEKKIHLVKQDGKLAAQDKTALFRLSVILEEFVYEFENDSHYSEEVALAKRLDDFIWSDNLDYFDA